MRMLKSHCALAGSALLLALLPTISGAQDDERAPFIRVYSQNGPGVASNYVTPAIDLGEDAYVFAVSIDLDGKIQVLHPDFPGISVRLRRDQQFRLPNFFAGYSRSGGGIVGPGRYSDYYTVGAEDDTRGTVIALASRRPFNLDRVERDGDWNIAQIRSLVEYRSPLSAAMALASYLGPQGEPIGRDYMRFASTRPYWYGGYADALSSCDLYYGVYNPGLSLSRIGIFNRVAALQRAGQNVRIVGYDFCGMPILAYGPSRVVAGNNPRPPREPDSVKSKESKFPRHIPSGQPAAPTAALGYFPGIGRTTPPQPLEGRIAPVPRSRTGGEVLIDTRNRPTTTFVPETRAAPAEHVAPPRRPEAATGTMPAREYARPIPREAPAPRVEPTRAAPPPPRVETPRVETPRYNPPPRVESKPAEPPPKGKQ